MIYEGVLWFFHALATMLNTLLSIKIINGISMLEIGLGIALATMLIGFLKFGFSGINSVSSIPTIKGNIENRKQKKNDRYIPRHADTSRYEKRYKNKH